MKKLIFAILSLLIFSTLSLPEPSVASTKKEKVSVKSSKKKVKKKVSKKKMKVKVRYSHHINKPQEGELLKLEGMVKDIDEQGFAQ